MYLSRAQKLLIERFQNRARDVPQMKTPANNSTDIQICYRKKCSEDWQRWRRSQIGCFERCRDQRRAPASKVLRNSDVWLVPAAVRETSIADRQRHKESPPISKTHEANAKRSGSNIRRWDRCLSVFRCISLPEYENTHVHNDDSAGRRRRPSFSGNDGLCGSAALPHSDAITNDDTKVRTLLSSSNGRCRDRPDIRR